MNTFQNNMLLNTDLFKNVDKRKNKYSSAVFVSLPVAVYGFEMYTSNVEEDFLTSSILELYEYYNNNFCPDAISRVSEDLALEPAFVRLITKKYEDSQENLIGESGANSESVHSGRLNKRTIYLMYDLYCGRILPYVLSEEKYEQFKYESLEENIIRLSLGDSRTYNPYRLKKCIEEPRYLDPKAVSDCVREYYEYGRKAKHTPTFTSYCECFDLIFACYYDRRNTTHYSVMHPFINERAKWLEDDIKRAQEKSSEFSNALDKMLCSVNTQKIHENSQHNDFHKECEKELERIYGDQINSFEAIKEQLIDTVMKYTVMIRHRKNNADPDVIEAAKRNYYFTMYTTIEMLFGYCFEENYNSANHRQYLNYVLSIDDSISGLYDLRKIVSDFGFDSSPITGKEKLYKKQLLWLFNNQCASNQNINTLLFANIIEAMVNGDSPHPFQYLLTEYKNIFDNVFDEDIDEVLNRAKILRNKSAHWSRKTLKWNYFDYQTFVFFLFNTIVLSPINSQKTFDINRFVDFEGLSEMEKKVDDAVAALSTQYQNLQNNDDARIKAENFMRASITQDLEFFIAADTLINEILCQVIFVCSGHSVYTQRKIIGKYISPDSNKMDVKRSMERLLEKYSYHVELIGGYDTNNIRTGRTGMYAEEMTTGNKLYYLLMLLDANMPSVLSMILKNNTKFVSDIELWLKLRGHCEQYRSTRTNEAENHNSPDYSFVTDSGIIEITNKKLDGLRDRLLQMCDNLCAYINEIERNVRNGKQ